MAEEDEQLDLVDSNDIKIGTISRSRIGTLKDGGGRYIRTACAFIRRKNGEYWIPRRTAHKHIAPNGLDFSMAEHMGVSESYLGAAIRGFDEELNLRVESSQLKLAGILGPIPTVPYFTAIYVYESDMEPDYNHDDFQEAHWLKAEDIISKIAAGTPAKALVVPSLKLVLVQEGQL